MVISPRLGFRFYGFEYNNLMNSPVKNISIENL